MQHRDVLGLIMARGGSKGVPKKNISLCGGRPLIEYTIEAAKRSTLITRLIVSTDNEEIAAISRACGAEVPFMRPTELAGDDVLDLPVVTHAFEWLTSTGNSLPDAVVHLRPTTPLKKTEDIDRGIDLLFLNDEAHSVRSVCEPIYTPFKMYRYDPATSPFLIPLMQADFPEVYHAFPEPYNMPRQKLPSVWRHSGYVDVIRTQTILQGSISGTKIVPLPFERWRDVDIDTPKDLVYAEMIITKLRQEGKETWE